MTHKKTAVLGASIKPERYSNKAVRLLKKHGHQVIPVHPLHEEIEGLPAAASIDQLPRDIDTVTVYLNAATSQDMGDALIQLAPRRVILNPGAESPKLESQLVEAGIAVEHACTLVLLQTGQY